MSGRQSTVERILGTPPRAYDQRLRRRARSVAVLLLLEADLQPDGPELELLSATIYALAIRRCLHPALVADVVACWAIKEYVRLLGRARAVRLLVSQTSRRRLRRRLARAARSEIGYRIFGRPPAPLPPEHRS